VFTPNRLAMLELLASQAAISIDNARVYAELARLNADLTQENSDRRKAEEALLASEERWRKLFENSSVGIALTAADGRFVAANVALQNMLGYTDEELRGLTAADVTVEEDRAAIEACISQVAEGERRIYRLKKHLARKDGGVIWADVNAVFVAASGSTPAFFALVVADITVAYLVPRRRRKVLRGLRCFHDRRDIAPDLARVRYQFGAEWVNQCGQSGRNPPGCPRSWRYVRSLRTQADVHL